MLDYHHILGTNQYQSILVKYTCKIRSPITTSRTHKRGIRDHKKHLDLKIDDLLAIIENNNTFKNVPIHY